MTAPRIADGDSRRQSSLLMRWVCARCRQHSCIHGFRHDRGAGLSIRNLSGAAAAANEGLSVEDHIARGACERICLDKVNERSIISAMQTAAKVKLGFDSRPLCGTTRSANGTKDCLRIRRVSENHHRHASGRRRTNNERRNSLLSNCRTFTS